MTDKIRYVKDHNYFVNEEGKEDKTTIYNNNSQNQMAFKDAKSAADYVSSKFPECNNGFEITQSDYYGHYYADNAKCIT